jgi:hypothetical protein
MEKPSSNRQLNANHENAKKSTGPRTVTGKAISRLNAMRHGIYAKHAVVLGPPIMENLAEYVSLLESLRAHFNPAGTLEDAMVQQIANSLWKLGRLERYEMAGITERMYAAISDTGRKAAEQAWNSSHLGEQLMTQSGEGPGHSSGASQRLQELIDFVIRSETERDVENDEAFLAFVWTEKVASKAEPETTKADGWMAVTCSYLANLAEDERKLLAADFRLKVAADLRGTLDARAREVSREYTVELSLVPDGAELEKLMRYGSYLFRHVERSLAMLLKLQAARRDRKGGV